MGEGLTDTPQGGGQWAEAGHVPVLLKEAIGFLGVRPGGTYIDATVGLGGHSYEIAKRLGAPDRLIGIDKDPAALEIASTRLRPLPELAGDWPQITLVHGSFADIEKRFGAASADGLLLDLGLSSLQLQEAARGFSFRTEGALDMRMNPLSGLTAEQVVNQFDERALADLIYEFGEERRSRRIARAIVRSRPIGTTVQLAAVVSAAARSMKSGRIHPATRTFQALRIFVNRELDDLKTLLESAPRILKPGGRLVIISFHSLEDRIVKDRLRDGVKQGYYRLLTKKPVTPGAEEMVHNPRSRSAKLRAGERV